MTTISDTFAIPDVEGVVGAGSVRPERKRRASNTRPVTVWSALEPWRAVLPAAYLALWVGFSLLPDAHPMLRVPTTVALALFIGVGTELCARSPQRGAIGRLARRTLWIVPAGTTIVTVMLLGSVSLRPSPATPLLAAAVIAIAGLQIMEISEWRALGSWSRLANTGVAFALALAVFVGTPALHIVIGAGLNSLVSALVALVLLRGCRASVRELAAYVGVTAAVVGELSVMVHDARPPYLTALVPLLGLYAISTTAQATLDRAPRRAYAEVVLVTVISLALVAIAVGRS
jgi:hypothetical protein